MAKLLLPTGQPYSPPVPEGMNLVVADGEVIISQRWRSMFPELFVAGGALLMLFGLVPMMQASTDLSEGKFGFNDVLGLMFFLPWQLLVLYLVVSLFLNSSYFIIKSDRVELKVGPCWYPGGRTVTRTDLNGFFVRYEQQRKKVYRVVTLNRDYKVRSLFNCIKTKENAEWLCDYLKNYYEAK